MKLEETPMLLAVSLLCLLSFFFFQKKKYNLSLVLLFLAAFVLRFWIASSDPFLHDWDERFHAIVAKNMMGHPLKPMLRANPVAPYDYTAWCCNHVWLHKQPLFLWQMALSLHFFGVNELALRLPSVLMVALLVFPIFSIGARLFNEQVAYLAAFAWALGYYTVELAAGTIGMDHNDVAFMFYITLSIWAFFNYLDRRSIASVVLMGVFAGCAVLCKWLAGMLVFSGMGLYVVQQKFSLKTVQDAAVALGAAVAVALPWQLYIHKRFPKESTYELAYNAKHIFEPLEGHEGGYDYYWDKLAFQYGPGFGLILLIGLLLTILKVKQDRSRVYLLLFIFVPYLFFSFVAKTKLATYVFLTAPMLFLISAYFFYHLYQPFAHADNKARPVFQALFFAAVGLYFLRYPEIRSLHFDHKPTQYLLIENRESKVHNTNIFRKLNALVPEGYVVLNTKSFEDTEAMFYSDRTAYHWWLSEADYVSAKAAGHKFAVFKDFSSQVVPDYIKNDPDLLVIPEELR